LAHGRGGKWSLMEWIAKRFEIENLDYLLIQAPFEEDVPEMKSPGYSWYLMPEYQGLSETRKALADLVNELSKTYSFNKIFWLGFSQGGVMGIDTCLRSASVLGGVICVSGFVLKIEEYPENLSPTFKDQRILMTHGERDPIVSFDRVKKNVESLRSFGVQVNFREYNKPHSFDLKAEVPELQDQLRSWMGRGV